MSKQTRKVKRPVYELRGGQFHSDHLVLGSPAARAISEEEIRVGFKVRLKSGGPVMTIIRVLSNNVCECRWNSGEELRDQLNRFPAAMLTPAHHN